MVAIVEAEAGRAALDTRRLVKIVQDLQSWIVDLIRDDPQRSLADVRLNQWPKPLLAIDYLAEVLAVKKLKTLFGPDRVVVLGEENLWNQNLDVARPDELARLLRRETPIGSDTIFALLDIVDGTDLLVRGLSNWCSAMVLYRPGTILGAFVGVADDGVYYATEAEAGAYWQSRNRALQRVPLTETSGVKSLAQANVCYYGQKIDKFLAVAKHKGWCKALAKTAKRKDDHHTRIYNLAGNPMMMRMLRGHVRMDAVFDISGQLPHDVVPGAYMAHKAGATIRGLDDQKDLDPARLARSLTRPADSRSRLRYVLAATPELATELVQALA